MVYTLVEPGLRDEMRRQCRRARVHYCDLLGHPIESISRVAGVAARMEPGVRAPLDQTYFKRIEAIEFAVRYDDGIGGGLDEADIVLVGVSRTSKTPLSIYLGYLGHKAANVPIVRGVDPPAPLFEIDRAKIVGLTIDPERLAEIREERVRSMGGAAAALRRPRGRSSRSSRRRQRIHRRLRCPVIDVSELSVEETAMRIIQLVADRHRRREPALGVTSPQREVRAARARDPARPLREGLGAARYWVIWWSAPSASRWSLFYVVLTPIWLGLRAAGVAGGAPLAGVRRNVVTRDRLRAATSLCEDCAPCATSTPSTRRPGRPRAARREGRRARGDDRARHPGARGLHDHDRRLPRDHADGRGARRARRRGRRARRDAPASAAGKRFGDPGDPLLVSVRSGAAISMPGMMDTILNLGLNDVAVEGLAAATGNPRFAFDSYRRLIQMYGEVVDGVDGHLFEQELPSLKERRGVRQDVDLDADDLRELIATFQEIYERDDRARRSRRTPASSCSARSARCSTRGTRRAHRSTGARTTSRTTSAPP